MNTLVSKTRAERRVAIARDALRRIGRKQIKPKLGVWFESHETIKTSKREADLGDNLPKKCEACALGAVFVGFASQGGAVKVSEMEDVSWWRSDRTLVKYNADAPFLFAKLKRVFTPNQLRLIELAFEGDDNVGSYHDLPDLPLKDAEAATSFHKRYMKKFGNKKGYSTKTLCAILRNIVRNDGVFKPADLDKVE